MQGTILDKIVQDKEKWVQLRKQQQPLVEFQSALTPTTRDFYQALSKDKPAFILECKKASPSKGVIREEFDPVEIAITYRDVASAVSVLTDEAYFQGRFEYLALVSEAIHQPVLCKDFIIDPYQIYLARSYGADAILLMLSVLSDSAYQQLAMVAQQLNMGILTEVSNEIEVERAIKLNARVVGINNRDLRDLSVNLDKTRQLGKLLPKTVTVISESGISNVSTIRELSQQVDGFLIGSSLMAKTNLGQALENLLYGQHKVCGLTQPEDVINAWYAGAGFAGLIFVPDSPRRINAQLAEKLMSTAPFRYVGVFRNAPLPEIVEIACKLGLYAVQLHGDEDKNYVATLRNALPTRIKIWKALSIKTSLPPLDWPHVDRYLLDNGSGGSGRCFDWSLLDNACLSNVILAGGINAENCQNAMGYNPCAVDLNSGVEQSPGKKDKTRLLDVFQALQQNNK